MNEKGNEDEKNHRRRPSHPRQPRLVGVFHRRTRPNPAKTVQRTGRVYPAAAVEIPEQTDGYGREICPDSEKRPVVANAETV